MSDVKLNLNQYVYKKLKFFKDQPELFLNVCKASMERLGKADHTPSDGWFIDRLKDPNYQFLSADNIIREATGFADREIFKSELIELDGWCLPPIDHITGLARYMNTKLSGILIPFLTADSKLYLLTKWKQGGQSEVFLPIAADYQKRQTDQRRIPVPVFYRCRIQVQKKVNPSKRDPKIKFTEHRFQYLISVDVNQVLSEENLQKTLASISLLPSEVKPKHRGQVVVLRGITWKTVNPAELWVKSEEKIKIIPQDPNQIKKDAKGNPIYEYKDADPIKHKLGQELLQMKHGTDEKPVDVYAFQLFVNSQRSDNLVACNIWNNQFGNPLIWIPSFYDIGKNIVSNFGVVKKEDSQDPYTNLDQHLRGTELLVLGKLSNIYRPNDRELYQLTIEIMFMGDVRFPFLEAEDRPLPILIDTYVKDLPVVETIGKPEDLKIGNLPKDLDLSLGMSYEELDKISKQFAKEPQAKPTETSEESTAIDAGINVRDYPHSDAFSDWLIRLANHFKERGYIEESKFAVTYSDMLIDLLEESDNVWRPGNPTHLVLTNEDSIAPDSDLYDYFVKHFIEGEDKSSTEPQLPKETPAKLEYPPEFMKYWDNLVDKFPSDIDDFDDKELMNYMVKQHIAEIIPTDAGLQLRLAKKAGAEIASIVLEYWKLKNKSTGEVLKEAMVESLKQDVQKVAEVIKEGSDVTHIQKGLEDTNFSPEENEFYDEFTKVLFGLFDKNTAESFKREYSSTLLDKLHQFKLVEVVGSHQDIIKWVVVPDKYQDNVKRSLKNWVVGFKIMGLKKLFPNYDPKTKTIQNISVPDETKDFLKAYKTDEKEVEWTIDGLDRKTRPTLHKIAKRMSIRGYTKGKKEDLIATMLEKYAEQSRTEPADSKDETQDELDALVDQLAASDIDSEGETTPIITIGITPEQEKDMADLKGSIKDYLKSGLVTNLTFSEIYHNLPGFLPTWVNETHENLIEKIIKTAKEEIANNNIEG